MTQTSMIYIPRQILHLRADQPAAAKPSRESIHRPVDPGDLALALESLLGVSLLVSCSLLKMMMVMMMMTGGAPVFMDWASLIARLLFPRGEGWRVSSVGSRAWLLRFLSRKVALYGWW